MAMTPGDMIRAIQANDAGKDMQCREKASREPWRYVGCPSWNFEEFDYREKPALVSGWLNLYPDNTCFHHTLMAAKCSSSDDMLRRVKVQEIEEDG